MSELEFKKSQQHKIPMSKLPQSMWLRALVVILVIISCIYLINAEWRALLWSVISLITIVILSFRQQLLEEKIYALDFQLALTLKRIEELNLNHKHTDQVNKQSSDAILDMQDDISISDDNDHHQTIDQQPSIDQDIDPAMPVWMRKDSGVTELNHQAQNRLDPPEARSILYTVMDWFRGGNSIVRIAIVILLIGVILLLRFASEYWQLTLSAKMAGIAASGVALTSLGYILRRKRFEYAISLQGAGLGILFLVLFSSYHLQVISSVIFGYALLCVLLMLTLILAIRQNALILAFIALASGFIAPFILNTDHQNIPALMGYLFVLNGALAVIAYYKPWRILNTLALLMTFGIGGFAIWFYAQPEQYFQISFWVWAIFIVYLFISIRYSQHVARLNTEFKEIPFIDTTLIFATPFMAFSLYAGLVNSDSQTLSIASAVLAGIYFTVGYLVHKTSQRLSMLSQCFYGLGIVFIALILPFALDAYWTSVGWAIHGFVVLWLGWRFGLRSTQYIGALLLLISGITTLFAHIWHDQAVLFAASLLMVLYASAACLLRYAHRHIGDHLSTPISNVFAFLFLALSFTLAPYVYENIVEKWQFNLHFEALPLLIWLLLSTAALWFKDRSYPIDWKTIIVVVLGITAIIMLSMQVNPSHADHFTAMSLGEKQELVWISLLWVIGYAVLIRDTQLNIVSASQKAILYMLTAIALCFLAVIGGVWFNPSLSYMWILLPSLLMIMTLYVQPLKFIRQYWVGNIAVLVLLICWLCHALITDTGQWLLPYVVVLNPSDLNGILTFMIIVYSMRIYLLGQQKESQMISAVVILFLGLLLISSLMLRVMHHYLALPYWSEQAWNDGVIQASLTILWAVTALILTTLASRQGWRYIWMLGIAVLALVILKLIFLDLSQSHTLTRIISFIGSGLIMLVIGYFSPLPPQYLDQKQ